MAIDTLQIGLEGKIDVAVLVTGDGDFVPLVRALMKNGIRVATVYFEYNSQRKSWVNEHLLRVSNYTLNINELKQNRQTEGKFRRLFRQPDKGNSQVKKSSDLFPHPIRSSR